MIIEQTVEIPADHRLIVELPADVPAGTAKVKLSISLGKKPAKMSRQMRNIMKFYGCLKDSPVFEGDPFQSENENKITGLYCCRFCHHNERYTSFQ
jgi:hypothetical protein